MNYKTFRYTVLRKLCRNCINQKYGLQLRRQDCRYWMYPAYCACCEQPQNIVVDIALFSRWKIWKLKKDRVISTHN